MTMFSGFSHKKWWFSIAMLVYQRVYFIILNRPLDALSNKARSVGSDPIRIIIQWGKGNQQRLETTKIVGCWWFNIWFDCQTKLVSVPKRYQPTSHFVPFGRQVHHVGAKHDHNFTTVYLPFSNECNYPYSWWLIPIIPCNYYNSWSCWSAYVAGQTPTLTFLH